MKKLKKEKSLNSWGGRRTGAGRPNFSGKPNHMRRPSFSPKNLIVIKMTVNPNRKLSKKKRVTKLLRECRCLAEKFDTQVMKERIHKKQIFFLVRSKDQKTLSRFCQSFCIRFAKKQIKESNSTNTPFFWGRYQMKVLLLKQEINGAISFFLKKSFEDQTINCLFKHTANKVDNLKPTPNPRP